MKALPIVGIVIVLVVGIGWVKNIIKLAECDFEAPYKAEVVHAVGIIPPVGMITGWLDLGK
jgi:hypothetical protein